MLRAVRVRLLESLRAFGAVFRNPELRRVELAWAGSETGKWLYLIALAVFAYEEGGAAAVGLVALIRTVPSALGAPFTALLGDRFRRERVMLLATLTRASLMAIAAGVVAADAPAFIVYAIAGLVTLVSTAFRPAQAAILPSLARTPEELTAANVAASTIASVGSFVGPAVGGLLLAWTSTQVVFLVTAATFLVAAFLVSRVRRSAVGEVPRELPEEGLIAEALAGFRTIAADRNLRLLTALYGAQAFVGGALSVLIVVSALELLDIGESGVGFLNSAFGVGGLLGALVALGLVARQRLASDFMIGIVLWGVPLVALGLWPEPAVAFGLLCLVGVGETIVEIAGPTLLQRSAPDQVLARVFGAVESMLVATIGLGSVVAPALVALVGIRGALIATGLLLPVLAVLFWRRLTVIDRAAAVPRRELALLRDVPIFAPLPPATLEELASSLVRVRVPAGDAVFRQGDAGDRFYVIGDGEVEVEIDGRPVRTMADGEYFGEIALLRAVPRTASVTARTDADLYTLDRDEFIAAVTGHAPSLAAADAVIGARLGSLRTGIASD